MLLFTQIEVMSRIYGGEQIPIPRYLANVLGHTLKPESGEWITNFVEIPRFIRRQQAVIVVIWDLFDPLLLICI
jgi:hypothetical protein